MRDRIVSSFKAALCYAPVSIVLIALVYLYWWIISQTTWSLIGYGWRGDSYDSLAASLLRGEADVELNKIQIEAFKINGRTFMYFGPFPAIFRLPFLVTASPWVGQLSPLSCFVAVMISLGSLALLSFYHARRWPIFSSAMLLGFGAGTPLLFLSISTSIYHEAIMWGIAGASGALVALIMILYGSRYPYFWLWLCSISASVAILSRVTFGVPAYLAVLIGIIQIAKDKRLKVAKVCITVLPASVGIIGQLWYNYARFGSVFALGKFGPDIFYLQVDQMGGCFNFARIPELFRIYFKPDTSFFFSESPYVRMHRVAFSNPAIFFSWKEPIAPLTITATWLVCMAVVSCVEIIRQRLWFLAAVVVAFMTTWLPILTFFNVTERFAGEFIPALMLIAGLGLMGERALYRLWPIRGAVVLLVVWSIFCTASSTAAWPPMMSGVPLVSEKLSAKAAEFSSY